MTAAYSFEVSGLISAHMLRIVVPLSSVFHISYQIYTFCIAADGGSVLPRSLERPLQSFTTLRPEILAIVLSFI
jgi:hypothetical protein